MLMHSGWFSLHNLSSCPEAFASPSSQMTCLLVTRPLYQHLITEGKHQFCSTSAVLKVEKDEITYRDYISVFPLLWTNRYNQELITPIGFLRTRLPCLVLSLVLSPVSGTRSLVNKSFLNEWIFNTEIRRQTLHFYFTSGSHINSKMNHEMTMCEWMQFPNYLLLFLSLKSHNFHGSKNVPVLSAGFMPTNGNWDLEIYMERYTRKSATSQLCLRMTKI